MDASIENRSNFYKKKRFLRSLPFYDMDNGYMLHIIASGILLILGIGSLTKRDKVEKARKRNDDSVLDALDI